MFQQSHDRTKEISGSRQLSYLENDSDDVGMTRCSFESWDYSIVHSLPMIEAKGLFLSY